MRIETSYLEGWVQVVDEIGPNISELEHSVFGDYLSEEDWPYQNVERVRHKQNKVLQEWQQEWVDKTREKQGRSMAESDEEEALQKVELNLGV